MTPQALYNRLTPTLQQAVKAAGCGYRDAPGEERFFSSPEEARRFCELVLEANPDDYNTYILRVVVVVEFKGSSDRLVFARNTPPLNVTEEQVATLFAAYHIDSPYKLEKLWQGKCGVFPMYQM